MSANLVLDKSFVQGASVEYFQQLASSHQFLMSAYLLYECTKASRTRRASIFAKFPPKVPPYLYISNLGHLLRHEINQKSPCGRPSTHALNRSYDSHARLADKNYELTKTEKDARNNVAEEVDADTKQYIKDIIKSCERLREEFDGIRHKSTTEAKIRDLEKKYTEDRSYIMNLIDNARSVPGSLIPKVDLDPTWLSFLWFQIVELFSLDIFMRYRNLGENTDPVILEKIKHDTLDIGLLALGVLEGGFATRERKLIRWWNLLKSEGTLIY